MYKRLSPHCRPGSTFTLFSCLSLVILSNKGKKTIKIHLCSSTSVVVKTQKMNSCTQATFSDILLHSEERCGGLGEQWPEVWHQLSSYVNPWGVFQNLILWEPLPWQGIPAGNWRPHPCHGHSRGPPPLDLHWQQGNTHASLLPTLSSHWATGPQTDGQFVFGWFWVTFLLDVSGCWAKSERSRTAAVWLHCGMCYRLYLQDEDLFCCFSPRKGHKWCVMSSREYVRASTSPCGLLFVSMWSTTISIACKCSLWSFHQSVRLCT